MNLLDSSDLSGGDGGQISAEDELSPDRQDGRDNYTGKRASIGFNCDPGQLDAVAAACRRLIAERLYSFRKPENRRY